jgi:hypothetical protein
MKTTSPLRQLQASHRQEVAKLAAALSRRGLTGPAARADFATSEALVAACRSSWLARSRVAAHITLAVSPHGPAIDAEERGRTVDPRRLAAEAVALDVLQLAARRSACDWWVERRGRRRAHAES